MIEEETETTIVKEDIRGMMITTGVAKSSTTVMATTEGIRGRLTMAGAAVE